MLAGPSVGGALLGGWWHALTRRVPDEGVFVLAALSRGHETGTAKAPGLEAVGGVAPKVRALIDSGQAIDTVIVSDEANRREAESALQASDRSGSVRVLNTADLPGRDPT